MDEKQKRDDEALDNDTRDPANDGKDSGNKEDGVPEGPPGN